MTCRLPYWQRIIRSIRSTNCHLPQCTEVAVLINRQMFCFGSQCLFDGNKQFNNCRMGGRWSTNDHRNCFYVVFVCWRHRHLFLFIFPFFLFYSFKHRISIRLSFMFRCVRELTKISLFRFHSDLRLFQMTKRIHFALIVSPHSTHEIKFCFSSLYWMFVVQLKVKFVV